MAKTFNNELNQYSPAKAFISTATPQPPVEIVESNYTPTEEEQEAIAKYEATPLEDRPRAEKVERRGRPKTNKEIKSKRVQLIFKQSTLDAIDQKADKLGLSRNEYITRLVDLDIQKNLVK